MLGTVRSRTSLLKIRGSEPGNWSGEASPGDRCRAGLAGGDSQRSSGPRSHGPAGFA